MAGIATEEQVLALEKLVEQQRLLQCEKILIGIIRNRASENYRVRCFVKSSTFAFPLPAASLLLAVELITKIGAQEQHMLELQREQLRKMDAGIEPVCIYIHTHASIHTGGLPFSLPSPSLLLSLPSPPLPHFRPSCTPLFLSLWSFLSLPLFHVLPSLTSLSLSLPPPLSS